MGSYAFGMSGIPWIVVSEVVLCYISSSFLFFLFLLMVCSVLQIFPINVKGSAGTLCVLVSAFCSWVVSYTFNYSFSWSPAGECESTDHFCLNSSVSCT